MRISDWSSDVCSSDLDDVILGCVGQIGGQAANIARNAVLSAGFPETVPATTVDRQCGSSQQALHFAAQAVMSGTMDIVLAGGVESMTRVPLSSAIKLAVDNGYDHPDRSEEHTSELQSLMRIPYAVFCL